MREVIFVDSDWVMRRLGSVFVGRECWDVGYLIGYLIERAAVWSIELLNYIQP